MAIYLIIYGAAQQESVRSKKNSTYNIEFCQEVIPFKGTLVKQGRPELHREDIVHA